MRLVIPLFLLLVLAACSSHQSRQVPEVNGVPNTGAGVGTGGMIGGTGGR